MVDPLEFNKDLDPIVNSYSVPDPTHEKQPESNGSGSATLAVTVPRREIRKRAAEVI